MSIEFQNDDERFLSAHITDLVSTSRKTGVPRFSRFLNERERIIAENAARAAGADPIFYGGYDGATRTVCGFFAGTYAEEMSIDSKYDLFSVQAVTFSFRNCDKLSHRDFLGAILNTGLERSVLGDIPTAEDHAVVFCLDTAAELVLGLTKIGRVGVKPELGITKEIPKAKFETLDRTVSSLRLDRLVGACTNLSGDRSASLIRSGQVSADFSVCLNVSSIVKENTVISIRGYGRFRLSKIVGETKKGKIHIIIEKYA
ncbi:MAG: hypothetical protein K2J80_08690 [Oscillospiraceae bacterium]|nr:hypothetical protein [Oscillospiraceae bacterium]